MHRRAFGGVGGQTRIAAAFLAAAMALGGGSAVAQADGPAGAYSNGPVSFFDQWIAHDSELQLAEGGVGTFTLGDGAMNTDQWSCHVDEKPERQHHDHPGDPHFPQRSRDGQCRRPVHRDHPT